MKGSMGHGHCHEVDLDHPFGYTDYTELWILEKLHQQF